MDLHECVHALKMSACAHVFACVYVCVICVTVFESKLVCMGFGSR